jgi:hypothetical protein
MLLFFGWLWSIFEDENNMFWVKPISVSGVNFVKTNGVGSPNLKIIDNITFLQADSVL